jgi:hypothetical protein
VSGDFVEGSLVGVDTLHALVELSVIVRANIDPIRVVKGLSPQLHSRVISGEGALPEKIANRLGAGGWGARIG